MFKILKLDEDYVKPIVKVDTFYNCRALLDTGADFPVWVVDERALSKLGAKLYMENIEFSGFGGRTTGNLYLMDFKLGDFVYKDMPIIAHKMPNRRFHMILSATMFEGMVYTVDTINNTLDIRTNDDMVIRHLEVQNSNGELHILLSNTYKTVEEYDKNKH